MTALIARLAGCKVYLTAAGLAGLALYKASTGEYAHAMAALAAAASTAGLRLTIAKQS